MRKKLFYFLTIIVVLLASGCLMQAETVIEAETTADIDEAIESIEDTDYTEDADESIQVEQESSTKPSEETLAAERANIFEKYNVLYEYRNSYFVTVKGAITYKYDKDISLAPDASWQEHLKYFLAMSFPSLFHEAAMERMEEMYNLYHGNHEKYDQFIAEGVPIDVIASVDEYHPGSIRFFLPIGCEFSDLNNDGIPEVFIKYCVPNSGEAWYEVFTFNGSTFERVGQLEGGEYTVRLYIDSQNRIVCIGDGIRLLELTDNQMVFSEYIDLTGSKTYNGVPYTEISGGIYYGYGDITATDLGLESLPEFDCSDIIDSMFR